MALRNDKIKLFEIAFSNPDKIYQPGDILDGNVQLETVEVIKIKGVTIEYKGKSNVAFTKGHGDSSTTYASTEKYFKREIWLTGPNDEGFELPAGKHVFPFEYLLPKDIPSSFAGVYGRVTYSILSKVHRPWRFDAKRKEMFIVKAPLYLNAFEDAMMEVRDSGQKTVCCWICASGPYSATFHVGRKGYVMGEKVTFHADIENLSSRDVTLLVWFCQKDTFYAAGKTEDFPTYHFEHLVRGPTVRAGGSEMWAGELTIPQDIPPSCLLHCNNIEVQYKIKLDVSPTFPSLSLQVKLPIYVGTEPWSEDLDPEVLQAQMASAEALAAKGVPTSQAEGGLDLPEGSEFKGDKTKLVLQEVEGEGERDGGDTAFSNPAYIGPQN